MIGDGVLPGRARELKLQDIDAIIDDRVTCSCASSRQSPS